MIQLSHVPEIINKNPFLGLHFERLAPLSSIFKTMFILTFILFLTFESPPEIFGRYFRTHRIYYIALRLHVQGQSEYEFQKKYEIFDILGWVGFSFKNYRKYVRL